ncbi:MAG: hypothetical protein ACRC8W_01960 [Plesiomonas shigelloides]
MNLTEDQLFTIEALNRVDGFVWPEKASNAWVNKDKSFVCFTVLGGSRVLSIKECRVYNGIYAKGVSESSQHQGWRNSLITREQFDSVDRWVRNNGDKIIFSGDYDVNRNGSVMRITGIWTQDSSVICWRYHKPTKETEMQPEAPKQPSIDELYSQYKTQRDIVESAKKTLADEIEAEDKLLEQIKAWNLEHGFDVRLLDESEEKPELVITDWRDLRIRDVIWLSGNSNHSEGEYRVLALEISSYESDHPICVGDDDDNEWIDISREQWKFIRRP